MFWHGGETTLVGATHVAGHSLAAMKNLHRALCDPYLQRHTHQGMGHAVAVALKLDVLVDVNLHRLEDGQLPGLHWQASQGRGVDLGKDTGAAPR